MKKTLLMTVGCLVVSAGLALAGPGGLNLGWNDCPSGGLYTQNRNFACTSNAGFNTMVGSYVAPCCITAASANEIVLDIQSTGLALPAWWTLRTGNACGRTSSNMTLGLDFRFAPYGACFDYWGGGASGGNSMDPPVGNKARIKALGALPAGSAGIGAIAEGTEVYSFQLTIDNKRTTGLGTTCPGCGVGVCIVLNSIKVNQVVGTPGGDKFISNPISSNITWQGGIGGDCYGATPTRNTTWGNVKALYR